MAGVLLDTHALIWLFSGEPMTIDALTAIAEARMEDRLFVSPISAWEAGLAVRKTNPARRPNLLGRDAVSWFRAGRAAIGARIAPIGQTIALEASKVPALFGHNDPGDCFILATAKVRRLAIVTRDKAMAKIAGAHRGYVGVVAC